MNYIKRKSKKQEDRTAKEFSELRKNSRTQIASGAIAGMKGDARTGERSTGFNQDDFLIENKFTDSDKYKFDLATWNKIVGEALRDNMRVPIMQIDVKDLSAIVIDLADLGGLGGNDYFGEDYPNFVTIPKAKSYLVKYSFIEELLILDQPCRLWFEKTKQNLVVVGKDDFMRFLAQNIDK